MIPNDILRSLRFMLDLGDAHVADIAHLSDPALAISREDVQAWLKKEDEPGYAPMPDRVLAHFLDGLIVHLRGRDDSRPPRPVEPRVDNNLVLKKLRVAFAMQDVDVARCFADAGFPVTKPELSALFRAPGHKNYRPCGDQMLRNFLRGLTLKLRR
ncbi:DUF1456 family protein [Arenimonas composti]|uniref:DUF1456 family protein n=1 Tax=Arenimonas composti TR7-09 = DSM 18010 TaxID=1121013 RepID=A0A091BAD3_9GAMM|nr:DUF1456 family protein [Arenimonas composti]KFN48701.1 hypothetical protein P873_13675 [Arenimonas composti TR7-09 = DSM 18010]